MNENISAILFILMFFNIPILLCTLMEFCNDGDIGFSYVNPVVIYNNVKVNWLGAALLSIILNIAFPLISIPYWIYKLCTIGRR